MTRTLTEHNPALGASFEPTHSDHFDGKSDLYKEAALDIVLEQALRDALVGSFENDPDVEQILRQAIPHFRRHVKRFIER